jgi:hypothetical protein
MEILVNTDHHIEGSSRLVESVKAVLDKFAQRFDSEVTRLEVHLRDDNGAEKDGNRDKHCSIEARPRGLRPVAATHAADTIDEAVQGAADKLYRLVSTRIDRLRQVKGSTSYSGQ